MGVVAQALLNIIPNLKGMVPSRVGHSRQHFNGTRLPAECVPPPPPLAAAKETNTGELPRVAS